MDDLDTDVVPEKSSIYKRIILYIVLFVLAIIFHSQNLQIPNIILLLIFIMSIPFGWLIVTLILVSLLFLPYIFMAAASGNSSSLFNINSIFKMAIILIPIILYFGSIFIDYLLS